MQQLCPISSTFNELMQELLTWQGATVMLRMGELKSLKQERLAVLIPQWSLLAQIFVDFKDAMAGEKRQAAKNCFLCLSRHCVEVEGLFVRNWCLVERDGLETLTDRSRFPKLRHLEFSCCDYLAHRNAVRIFEAHPELRSLRATFSPKATVTKTFVDAAPSSLALLGFVNFGQDVGLLASLLARCPLEHLWFGRTANFSSPMVEVLAASKIRTLCLPEAARLTPVGRVTNEHVLALLRSCAKLELLMVWGVDPPKEQVEAAGFEILPESLGTSVPIMRRMGSTACLASNGTLWSPYSQTDAELVASTI